MVGRLITTDTTRPPDRRRGKYQPRVLTTGAIATRVGYFMTIRQPDRPLARAISVYGLLSSSSRLARTTRAIWAVPATPSTIMGSQMWDRRSPTLAQDQGALRYSAEKRPVTVTPNWSNATHMRTRASMKFGVARPM